MAPLANTLNAPPAKRRAALRQVTRWTIVVLAALFLGGLGMTLLAQYSVREDRAAVDGLLARLDSARVRLSYATSNADSISLHSQLASHGPAIASAEYHLASNREVSDVLLRSTVALGLGLLIVSGFSWRLRSRTSEHSGRSAGGAT